MEKQRQEQVGKDVKVRTLHLTPRARGVPPLTDAEITALRELLVQAQHIAETCPIAKRVFSKR